MKQFLKQLIGNVSSGSTQLSDRIGDEEAFREIVDWNDFKEDIFLYSVNALISKKMSKDELKKCETVNQLLYMVDTDGKAKAGELG